MLVNKVTCELCNGSGLNPKTKALEDVLCDEDGNIQGITEDEIRTLIERRGLSRGQASQYLKSGSLDSLDLWRILKVRAKKLGVWGKCRACSGEGKIPFNEMLN